jgi:Mn-dependent DtxR family transcriptional regulator
MSNEDITKIREMMEFLVKQKISEKISKLASTERKIYELTGVQGQTEIVKTLNTAPNTVSNLWKKLESEGVLIKDGKKYRKVV